MPHVHAVDGDAALGHVIEPGDQLAQGGLSAAGGAYHRHRLAHRHMQRHIVQHLVGAVVGKADAVHVDGAPHRGHRLCVGVVGNGGLGAHQLDEPVQSREAVGEQLGKVGQLPHRGDKRGDVQAEGDQIHIVHPVAHYQPAAPGDNRHVQQCDEQLHGGVEPAHLLMEAPFGGLEGLVGAVEPLLLDGLVAEGLHRADTAETGFDLGIDGAGLLLGRHRGAAHAAPQQHQHHQKHRNDGHDDQRHAPLDAEHHRQRTHDGDQRDGQILRPVVGQLRQLEKIGGQAAHQLAGAVAVIEIKAQHLHVVEQIPADVRLHPDTEGVTPIGHDIIEARPQHKGQRHNDHHREKHPVVLLRQPLVQRHAADQRKGQIHHGDEDGAADIQRKQLPMGLEIAQEYPQRTAGTVILRCHISIPFPKIILQF